MFEIVDISKALACIFIFLYHCNTILPGEWKFMTLFGEDMGNCLFFMVSGFALFPSIQRSSPKDFPGWYKRRLLRILPLLVFAYAAAYIFGFFGFSDPAQIVAVFLYPTLYWFATGILWFYIFLFWLGKLLKKEYFPLICTLLFILRQLRAGTTESHYIMGFLAMAAGYAVRGLIPEEDSRGRWAALAGALASMAAYLWLKTSQAGGEATGAVYAFMGFFTLSFCALLLIWGMKDRDPLSAFFEKRKLMHSFIRTLGEMALPLYIVQCWCGGYIGFYICMHVNFPLSYLVNFAVVWTLTVLVWFVFCKCPALRRHK